MLKKISLTVLTVLMFSLSGCDDDPIVEEQKTDLEIVYEELAKVSFENTMVSEDIVFPTSDIEGITFEWRTSKSEYITTEGNVVIPSGIIGDVDVSITLVVTLNDAVASKNFEFTVIAEAVDTNLNTDYTDNLAIDFQYDSTSFINDGIGEVTLVRCVDGDTAIFQDGNTTFSARFLGIDTPESTYKFDPWGKPASEFTCDKLENATTIVLEADVAAGRMDSNERYLSWIWYDGRLLNLELLEEAYTKTKSVSGLKYETVFYDAEFKTKPTERRVWGELDDTFDYSLDGIQVTIEEIVTNMSEYYSKKVVIRGTISHVVSGSPYIQQDGYGIYLYAGYVSSEKIAVGNYILVQGVVVTEHPTDGTGSIQLTNFDRNNMIVLSSDNVVTPEIKTIPELDTNDIGSFITLNNLTVKSVTSYDGAVTVIGEDSLGNTITIYRASYSDINVTADLFTVGASFNISAPLTRFNSKLQMVITSIDDIDFN